MTTAPYYQTVFIKSEEDLPKDGQYIIMFNKNYVGLSDNGLRLYNLNRTNNRYSNSISEWLEHVDWYLLPVSQPAVVMPDEEEINKWAEERFGSGNVHQRLSKCAAADGINWLKSNLKQGYPEEFIRWLSWNLAKKKITLTLPILYILVEVSDMDKKDFTLPELYQWWITNIKDK